MEFPVLLFLAIFSNVQHQGVALTCYQCNSHNDTRCLLTSLPDELKQQCGPEDTLCRKISHVVEFKMNSIAADSRVIRRCGRHENNYYEIAVPLSQRECYHLAGYGSTHKVCSCQEDGCNSSSIPIGATALMLLTFVLLRF